MYGQHREEKKSAEKLSLFGNLYFVLLVFIQVYTESSYGSGEVNIVTFFNRHAFEFHWLFLLRKSDFLSG